MTTLPETNIPSETWWLEDDPFLLGKAHVVGGYHPHGHQLGEGTPHCLTHRILGKSPDPRGRSRSPLGDLVVSDGCIYFTGRMDVVLQ